MIKEEDFLRIVHKTLDELAENYRRSFDERGRSETDEACYDFVDNVIGSESHRIGFRDRYDKRKRE